jgi:hypothetical protein
MNCFKITLFCVIIAFSTLFLGCGIIVGKPEISPIVEIDTNETAFLVPMEGATDTQGKFMSEAYLEENKIAAKRVTIPIRKRKIGRLPASYEWIPTMRVVTVKRTPITREWTGDNNSGTTTNNELIYVESNESIGFGVGINITANIPEENTARFLYWYSGKQLDEIIDTNIRSKVASVLAIECGKRTIEQNRKEKESISKTIFDETTNHFKDMGINISNIGIVGGFEYEDEEIQDSINNTFTSEMQIIEENNINASQAKINQRNVDIANADRRAAEEFAKAAEARTAQVRLEIELIKAQAQKTMAEKWNGAMPEKIIPSDSNLLMSLE